MKIKFGLLVIMLAGYVSPAAAMTQKGSAAAGAANIEAASRISQHVHYTGGMLCDRADLLDNSVQNALAAALSTRTNNIIRILEVGPGDSNSSAVLRLISAILSRKVSFPSDVSVEIWVGETCDAHRESIKSELEKLSKSWNKKFPKMNSFASRQPGQNFFTGKAFDELVLRAGPQPFDLIIAANVLHFMRPTEQSRFISGISDSLRPQGHMIVTTKGVHESAEFHAAAQSEQDRFIISVEQQFDLNFSRGEHIFAGYCEEHFNACVELGAFGIVSHSHETVRNLINEHARGDLLLTRCDEVLIPSQIRLPTGTRIKRVPSVIALATKR